LRLRGNLLESFPSSKYDKTQRYAVLGQKFPHKQKVSPNALWRIQVDSAPLPMTIIVTVGSLISLFYQGIGWIKQKMAEQPPSPSTVLRSVTTHQPAILPPQRNGDPPSVLIYFMINYR
jgi:hypothetical protein